MLCFRVQKTNGGVAKKQVTSTNYRRTERSPWFMRSSVGLGVGVGGQMYVGGELGRGKKSLLGHFSPFTKNNSVTIQISKSM